MDNYTVNAVRVFLSVEPRHKRAHAVPEKKHGNIFKSFVQKVVHPLKIVNDQLVAVFFGKIAEILLRGSGFSVAEMIVSRNRKAAPEKILNERCISSYVV